MDHQEIERKFFVKKIPADLEEYRSSRILQGYLTQPGETSTIRVRRLDNQYFLTVKQSRNRDSLIRDEVEMPMEEQYFQPLWNLTRGRQIEKRRFYLPWKEHTIELDLFEGKLKGLVLAEIEFDSEESSRDIDLPPWFGAELTRDYRYTNSSLALNGLPGDHL